MPRQLHAWDHLSGLPFESTQTRKDSSSVRTSGLARERLPHSPHLLGLAFAAQSWGETLLVLDAAARARGNSRTVGFLTLAGLCRAMIDPAARDAGSARMLLPADGTVAAMLSLATRRPVDTFGPAEVVSSLLTFMEPRRILLAGANPRRLEATRRFIRAHAPWHEVSMARTKELAGWRPETAFGSPDQATGADLLLIDGAGYGAERQMARNPDLRPHGLILLCSDLFGACARR
ncbi:UDP-N-acetyl-D-mannosaminuronic acid transferase (WecB/TagA/CpsF family) [Neorhizobium galegae]|uniref:hypothetical protein n=1 Tax=Neorhizobium galegae TaxID=399 RepID=UPI001AE5948B|nr:hypothetical protein [Neorhizobium galegae]MBP2548032.1 UDP-N-acetyl-D-mannosaminuronic acid transferase (WecB/TagA/CpsF family) [Neorhizobium galegae]